MQTLALRPRHRDWRGGEASGVRAAQFHHFDTEHGNVQRGIREDISISCPAPKIKPRRVVSYTFQHVRRNSKDWFGNRPFRPDHKRGSGTALRRQIWKTVVDGQRVARGQGVGPTPSLAGWRGPTIFQSWSKLPDSNPLRVGFVIDCILLHRLGKRNVSALHRYQSIAVEGNGVLTSLYKRATFLNFRLQLLHLIASCLRKLLGVRGLGFSGISKTPRGVGLILGLHREFVGVGRARSHFLPLKADKQSGSRQNKHRRPGPAQCRTLESTT